LLDGGHNVLSIRYGQGNALKGLVQAKLHITRLKVVVLNRN
jgi:hypothetical protein